MDSFNELKKPRIWIDMTNAPHVLIFKPLINSFKQRGCEVFITARVFSQTVDLLNLHKIDFTLIGHHRGKKILSKAWGLFSRSASLIKYGYGKNFDLAVSHGSNDLAVASKFLRIPHVTMFDYEFAQASHGVNLRLSKRALIPGMIPIDYLEKTYSLDNGFIMTYDGLKEEYYLSDFVPDETVVEGLGLDRKKIFGVIRTPPDTAMYHRFENPLFEDLLDYLHNRSDIEVVLLPRTQEQKERLRKLNFSNMIIPDGAVDAQSLIYCADFTISAGGTMNREAVVLGTPAFTVFEGKMGAIDNQLIELGKMIKLSNISQLDGLSKKVSGKILKRDPFILADKILSVLSDGNKTKY